LSRMKWERCLLSEMASCRWLRKRERPSELTWALDLADDGRHLKLSQESHLTVTTRGTSAVNELLLQHGALILVYHIADFHREHPADTFWGIRRHTA
jgi:hypothetical protein